MHFANPFDDTRVCRPVVGSVESFCPILCCLCRHTAYSSFSVKSISANVDPFILHTEGHAMAAKSIESLGEDQATLRQIVLASPIPTFVIDARHTVIHWNRALEKLCGHGADEMIGSRRQWVIFRSGKRPTMADAIVDRKPVDNMAPYFGSRISLSKLIEGAYEAEAFFPNMGENGRWLFITAAPIRRPDGTTAGAMETLWDKTVEKRANMERERRNRDLSGLFAISDALCASLDLEERLDSACREISVFLPVEGIRIFEWDTASGARPIHLFGAVGDFMSEHGTVAMDKWVGHVARSRRITRFEGTFETPGSGSRDDPERSYKSVTLIPSLSRDRCWVISLFGSPRSTTSPQEREVLGLIGNRIAAAIENTILHERLMETERLAAVGQTVAGMAHYIKNILIGLKGGSYVVNVGLGRDDPIKLKEGWIAVQHNIARVSDLVQDLLTFSKKREPEYAPCSPNDIAREICELLRKRAGEDRIELVADLDPKIAQVMMDSRSIHRCLLNLVVNAMDACATDETPNKQRRVHVRTMLKRGGWIRFEVQDNGIGMDAGTRNRLFTAFFSTKGGKGTGLGLMVTQKLVEEQQGTMTVESRPRKGSTFGFKLPYTLVEPP